MRALRHKPRGWRRFAIISLPGSWQHLGRQPLIHSPPSSASVDTESAQERVPTATREGKFSLLNLVSYLGHMYPVLLLCRGRRRADSLGVAMWLLQEQKSTEQRVLRNQAEGLQRRVITLRQRERETATASSLPSWPSRGKKLSSLIRAQ